mgnify:CR=1 FL=1
MNEINFGEPETYFSREHGVFPGRHESVTSILLGSPADDASDEQRFWHQGEVVGYIHKHALKHGSKPWEATSYTVTAWEYDIDAVEFFPGNYSTGARGALAAAKSYARTHIKEEES